MLGWEERACHLPWIPGVSGGLRADGFTALFWMCVLKCIMLGEVASR